MIKILGSILDIIKNMTLKDILLAIVVLAFLITAWKANAYRNDSIKNHALYESIQKELEIEKDNNKVEENLKENKKLKSDINKMNAELVILYAELKTLNNVSNTRTEIMEKLNLENTEDICDALADFGYPICSKF